MQRPTRVDGESRHTSVEQSDTAPGEPVLTGLPGADHILIGRKEGIERDWTLLQTEFEKALRKLKARAG